LLNECLYFETQRKIRKNDDKDGSRKRLHEEILQVAVAQSAKLMCEELDLLKSQTYTC